MIAAITSCTNTSNPVVLIAAGLLARNARARGLTTKPWVKTSLAPGSKVVTDYLSQAGLIDELEALGFYLLGYGCTTCIGNSGPLPDEIEAAIREGNLLATSVLSGNRNFEGRIHQEVRANYRASPPLIVAYALGGNMPVDLYNDPLGDDADGNPVYLKDIWPDNAAIAEVRDGAINAEMFRDKYSDVYTGNETWNQILSQILTVTTVHLRPMYSNPRFSRTSRTLIQAYRRSKTPVASSKSQTASRQITSPRRAPLQIPVLPEPI